MSVRVSWGIDSEEEKKIVCYSNETGEKKKIATFDANNFANIFTAFQGTTDSEVTKRNVMKNINQYIYDLYLKILNNSYLVGEDQSFKDSKQKILSDFITKIESNSESNSYIINNFQNKTIKELRKENSNINEFIVQLCNSNKVSENHYDGFSFLPIKFRDHNQPGLIKFPDGDYIKKSSNKLEDYIKENQNLSQLIYVNINDSFKKYLDQNSSLYNNIFLKYVPNNNDLHSWLRNYENNIKNKGFNFGNEKEKIEITTFFAGSPDTQTVEIPKYITESSTKNKEEVVDQVIKYGFLGNSNYGGSFIMYATKQSLMNLLYNFVIVIKCLKINMIVIVFYQKKLEIIINPVL